MARHSTKRSLILAFSTWNSLGNNADPIARVGANASTRWIDDGVALGSCSLAWDEWSD